MFDSTTLSIRGNVVANPVHSGVGTEKERVSFRVVSNRRRRNQHTGEWEEAGNYGINVVCWRKLARGVANSIRLGDPVLVTGRMVRKDFIGKDGERRWMDELSADFVGTNLSLGQHGVFTRFTKLDRITETDQDDTVDDVDPADFDQPEAEGSDGVGTDVFAMVGDGELTAAAF